MKSKKYYLNSYADLESYCDRVISKESSFTYNTENLLYRTIKNKDLSPGEAIIFIHGWGSSMLNWYFQIPDRIFSNYTVYLVDLPGHGRNRDFANISKVTYESYLDILASFIDEVIGVSCIGVGHSMGGVLTKMLYNNKKLSKAIYINPAVPVNVGKVILENKFIIRALETKDKSFSKLIDRLIRNVYIMKIWSDQLGDKESHSSVTNEIITVADMLQTGYNAFWGFLINMINNYPKGLSFKELTQDELYIVSKNDVTYSESYYSNIDNERLKILEKGGHCTPRTIYTEVNQLIKDFLKN